MKKQLRKRQTRRAKLNEMKPRKDYGLGGDVFSGAMSGASAGSVAGPWGTAIGAVGGAGLALLGNESKQRDAAKVKKSQLHAADVDTAYANYEGGGQRYNAMLNNGGRAKRRFDSQEEAMQYYREAGAGSPVIYNPSNKIVTGYDKDAKGLVKELSSDKDFKKTAKYLKNRTIPTKLKATLKNGGRAKYPYGGKVDYDTANAYAKKVGGLDKFMWDNYLNQGKKASEMDDIEYGMRVNRANILKEVPSTKEQIVDGNPNEIKYLNNLMGRVQPHMTKDNTDMLMKGNNPWNIAKKVNFVRDLDLYKNDIDSISKYLPEFSDMNNLSMAKPFLKEGDIPEYEEGGQVGMVPVEVEGEESAVTPFGQDINFEGPKHSQGGIPVDLPEETYVFSENLKANGGRVSFSDLNKNLTSRMKPYKKTLDDPSSTGISRNTAEKMMTKLRGEQSQLKQSNDIARGEVETGNSFEDGGEVTRGKIASMINKSIDDLYSRYEQTGYNTANGANSDYKTMLEDKRSRMLGHLDEVDTPERLEKLYGTLSQAPGMSANGNGNDSDLSGMGPLMDLINPAEGQAGEFSSPFDHTPSDPYSFAPAPEQEYATDRDDPLEMEPWMTQPDDFRYSGSTTNFEEIDQYLPQQRHPGEDLTGMTAAPARMETKQLQGQLAQQAGPEFADSSTFAGDALRGVQGFGQRAMGALGGAEGIATMAPALYNIGQGLFGKADQMNPNQYQNNAGMAAAARMRDRRFNIDPQLQGNRTANAIGNRNMTNAARTRGELLSGLSSNSAQRGQNDMAAYAQAENMNNQYAGQADQMSAQVGAQNAASRMNTADWNARSNAAQSNMLGAGMSQLSGMFQQRQRNKALASADDARVNLLKNIFPNANFNA